ncbi:DUF4153 domain-containing protein [Oryzobacter telluris]|uniref:DUF4153 domain-containing protein n=1 Tax=Oryzobacter telluris TaxID=3149179 RepID=UPI00370DB145
MNTDRPLDGVGSIKVKLGLLVGISVLVAVTIAEVADGGRVPLWLSVPVTVVGALAVTQWLARGMTSPLREMTAAAQAMAAGDYGQRVRASSTDEVGELGRTFNAMAADLASADQQRRQLVATVSHELRTPLTAQRALLENLVDGVVRPDDAALRGALAQSERLSALVTDLLDLSRIDAGAAPLRLAEVKVAGLLRAAVAEASVDGRPVRVRDVVEPADLVVQADPGRLAQLVANLVDNAVRHSPAGGEVLLTARGLDDTRWVLEVRDEGPGIPADRAERVFERFGSGDDASGGTGLGLAIARWVAELHGGEVSAVPTPPDTTGALLRAVLPRRARATRPTHLQEERAMTTLTPDPAPAPPPAPAAPAPLAPDAPGPQNPYARGDGGGFLGAGSPWPEADGRPRPGVVLAALGIGAWASVTWPERNVGIAVTATMLGAGYLMWSVARFRRTTFTIACAVAAALLVSVTALRDAGGVVVLAVLVAVVVAAAGLTRARTVLAVPLAVMAWPLSALRGLPLLGRTITTTSRMRVLWPVLRTVGFSLVVLAVFGGLFASGDAVFGTWAEAVVPDLGWDTIVMRTFVLVLVAGVVLTGAYLALNPPATADAALPASRRASRPWEWAVPVGIVVALFAGFLVAQAAAMWGGHTYLRETTGLTYAEYVHQGFGQLTAATFLTVVVVALTMRVARRESARDGLLLRLLLGVLCVLTLAVVASALYRMSLYQEAYGYTVLRVFVDGFELWLGLVVAFLLAGVVRLRGSWIPRAVLVSAAVFALGFAAMNPDGWVADRNIDRFEAGKPLDTLYLSTLSADATPVLAERLPRDIARCVADPGRGFEGTGKDDDLLGWNLGRSRAVAAVKGLPVASTGCSSVVVEEYRPR